MKAIVTTNLFGSPFSGPSVPIWSCLSLGMVLGMSLVPASKAHAQASTASPSTPSIGLTYQVVTAAGSPRIYQDQDGPTYWKEGLAIEQGDQIQIQGDVASGTQTMVQFQARIDHLSPVTVTAAPWVVALDTKTLGLGQHNLEVQAQLGGRQTRLAKRTTVFTLTSALVTPPAPIGAGSGVVTSVEGTEQVLSQGNVTSVPLPSDTITLPPLIASKSLDGNALITLDLGSAGNGAIKAGKPVVLDLSITVRVRPQPVSSAHRYVFSIARNGNVIYTSPSILDADSAQIRLLPKTHDQTGLLPGIVHLYVWGVDDAGSYGPAAEATLDVRQPHQSASSGQ